MYTNHLNNLYAGGNVFFMNIALIAHDKKKEDIIKYCIDYNHILNKHTLYATGTTGTKITEATGRSVTRFQSGSLGGDQQIGAMIEYNELVLVIFIIDH